MNPEDIVTPTRRRFLQLAGSSMATTAMPGRGLAAIVGQAGSVGGEVAAMGDLPFLKHWSELLLPAAIQLLEKGDPNSAIAAVADAVCGLARWSNLTEQERKLVLSSMVYDEYSINCSALPLQYQSLELWDTGIGREHLLTEDGIVDTACGLLEKVADFYPDESLMDCINQVFHMHNGIYAEDIEPLEKLPFKEQIRVLLGLSGENCIGTNFTYTGQSAEVYKAVVTDLLDIGKYSFQDSLRRFANYKSFVQEYGEEVGERVFERSTATIARSYGLTEETARKFAEDRLKQESKKSAAFMDIKRTEGKGFDSGNVFYTFKLHDPNAHDPFTMIKLGLVLINMHAQQADDESSEPFGLRWKGDHALTASFKAYSDMDDQLASVIVGSRIWTSAKDGAALFYKPHSGLEPSAPVDLKAESQPTGWQAQGFRL